MVDKPRNPRRGPAAPAGRGGGRPAGKGGPGERPAANGRQGRPAGKPGMGPAKNSRVGGVDRNVIEELERQGMLTAEGRRMLTGGEGPKAGPRQKLGEQMSRLGGPAVRKARPEGADRPDRGPRPERSERPERGPRPERGERPERGRGDRPERGGRGRTTEGPIARHPRPSNTTEHLVSERLHKVMAQAGVASRRHSEELIQAGRVTVNGKVVTELGTKVLLGRDRIEVDGRPLGKPEDLVYILMNKPKGYVTTLFDPQGRAKVTDLLGEDIGARVYPVGRLDFETEGLLLLTNDGELANALMHPAKQVKKTYIAKVRGVPGPAKLRALEEGIELDDGPTAPAEVKLIEAKGPNAATVSIRIHEGRNRQVRRMFEAVGHEVIHLKRTTLGPLHIKELQLGQWRELTDREVTELKSAAGLAPSRAAKVAAITEAKKARRGAARVAAAPRGPRPGTEEETGMPGPTPRPRPQRAGARKNRGPR